MQRMKGQMYCTVWYPGMCHQVTESAPSLGPERSFKVKACSCLFLLQRYRSARQSPVQNISRATVQGGVSGLDKQLQVFYFLCTNMASLSLFQDVVSGVHKITRYNDEGLKRRENSLISFPLEIKYLPEVYT